MTMACQGCLPNEREQAQLWETALKKAKEYAKENGVMVVVYKNELGEAHFIQADAARKIGISGQYVSPV